MSRRALIIGATLLVACVTLGPVARAQDYYRYVLTAFTGGTVTTPILYPDGTGGAPAIAFASEPTLGFWRQSAAVVRLQGSLSVTATVNSGGNVIAAGSYILTGFGALLGSAEGNLVLRNNANTIGVLFKIDALPTLSGFGTTPAVTAGSTPYSGSVNVGTGGAATSGVITWGGTAYPASPFCTYSTTLTNAVTRGTPTTTQLTLNSTTAWTASDVVTWNCPASK